jgi:hypothetical protein
MSFRLPASGRTRGAMRQNARGAMHRSANFRRTRR